MALGGEHEGTSVIGRTHFLTWLLRAGLAFAFVMLIGVSGPEAAEDISREQQIADLEAQIQDLAKKLAELKRMQTSPSPKAETAIPAAWV